MASTRPTCAALTGGMALALLLNAFALNALVWFASPPVETLSPATRVMLGAGADLKETVLHHTWRVLHAEGGDDSWGIMSIAYDYARSPHTTPLYSEIFFNRHIKMQYPPSALFVIAGLRAIDPARIHLNDNYAGPRPALDEAFGLLFLALTALVTAAMLELRLRQTQAFSGCDNLVAARVLLVAGFALTFYPLVKGYTLGQIQVWLNGLFALALLCWATGWKATSGVLIGLVCLVKPHYGVFLIWGAVRREWRMVAACAATAGVGLIASVAVFGLADHIDYLRVLSFMSERGEAYYPNQSVNGLLNRLVGDPMLDLQFFYDRFPPFNLLVYGGTLAAAAMLLLTAVFVRRAGDTLDFCIMALSATVASPIAWEHHYGVLLPVFAVLLAAGRGKFWLFAGFILASNFFPALNLLAPTYFNVAQSYLLAAALIVMAMLHRRARDDARPAGA
jgi:hypothetical protein